MENEVIKIRELGMEHYYDPAMMVNFSNMYSATKLIVEKEGTEYELVDFYCKNMDCDCTESRMAVLTNGNEVGEIWYDYKDKTPCQASRYNFLLTEIINDAEFNELLAQRHTIVKLEYEIFVYKINVKQLEEQEKELKKTLKISSIKVGRNDPCPCGSGKKYKKCCI